MPRATCRCGELLIVPAGDTRVVCPRCSARVKVRVTGPPPPSAAEAVGFLRFFCPCGRRLKVDAANPPAQGKCPDCGQVVPVPARAPGAHLAPGHPETPTEELTAAEASLLETWSRGHRAQNGSAVVVGELSGSTAMLAQPFAPKEADRAEVGLRVCPACGRPVHLGAETCRGCGAAVPRR